MDKAGESGSRHGLRVTGNRDSDFVAALANAGLELLEFGDLEKTLAGCVARIGQGSGNHRCHIFRRHTAPGTGRVIVSQIHEWTAAGIRPEFDNPALQNLPLEEDFGRWVRAFEKEEIIVGDVAGFPESERSLLTAQDIHSILVVPIPSAEGFWGFIGLDHCGGSFSWSDSAVDLFRKFGRALGEFIVWRERLGRTERARDRLRLDRDYQEHLAGEERAAADSRGRTLAALSHDIRTPLNAVLGMAELLLEREPPGTTAHEYLSIIKSSSEQILDLVENFLDFARAEAGVLNLEPVEFSLRETVEEVLRTLGLQAKDKGLVLESAVAPDFPEKIVADRRRVREILINMVGNAVKFSSRGFVRVEAEIQEPSGKQPVVVLRVLDTGCGLPETGRAGLFLPFVTGAGAPASGGPRGTGLGLFICKTLAELMGGTIGCRDREGGGSEFWVSFPLLTASQKSAAAPGPERPMRVLVVDNNRVNRLVARRLLEKLGLAPEEAAGGRAAVEAVKNTEYGMVFMDLCMPEMDGFQATREILRSCAERSAPAPRIFAVTACADEESHNRALEAGMEAVICKPVSLESLARGIGRVAPRAPTVPEPAGRAPGFASEDFDAGALRDSLGGGTPVETAEIGSAFLETLAARHREMKEAFHEGCWERVADCARELRSSALSAHAGYVAEAAGLIERSARARDSSAILKYITQLEGHMWRAREAMRIALGGMPAGRAVRES